MKFIKYKFIYLNTKSVVGWYLPIEIRIKVIIFIVLIDLDVEPEVVILIIWVSFIFENHSLKIIILNIRFIFIL